mgnify:CR=1 FL=1
MEKNKYLISVVEASKKYGFLEISYIAWLESAKPIYHT